MPSFGHTRIRSRKFPIKINAVKIILIDNPFAMSHKRGTKRVRRSHFYKPVAFQSLNRQTYLQIRILLFQRCHTPKLLGIHYLYGIIGCCYVAEGIIDMRHQRRIGHILESRRYIGHDHLLTLLLSRCIRPCFHYVAPRVLIRLRSHRHDKAYYDTHAQSAITEFSHDN